MSTKAAILSNVLQRRWALYVAVFVIFVALHVFIFRDVVANIPAVWRGDAAIVREELVPFFSFATQFWGEDSSTLTSSDDVRVGYSFWTAWLRYAPVLPVALVLVSALSAFLLFYAFHIVGRYFSRERPYFGIAAAFLAAVVIHGILLYAKVAHFYVLIIGFSMFALAMSLVIEQVFFRQNLRWRNVIAVAATVLANPAVHYHVIFYLLLTVLLLVFSVFVWVMNRSFFWFYLKKHLIYFLSVVILSLVPYAILMWIVTANSLGSVSTDIPVNYWMIYYSSLALPVIFTFDTAGHLDLMRYGNYLAPLPRIGSVIITFLIGSLFLFAYWARLNLIRKVLIVTLFVMTLAAMWMSLGYSPSGVFSFHMALAGLAGFLADQSSAAAEALSRGLSLFINILRFPHRFQFIYFYVGGLLFMLALLWLQDKWQRRLGKRFVAGGLVALVGLFPLYASGDYRTALTSGNLASFAAPYPIPEDLKHIKQFLAQQQNNKLFVLPTLESGREIVANGQRYSFLDKFFTYYLNQPTLYYGVGASTQNKLIAYLAYQAIEKQQQWWEEVLVNNLGVTHILVPKHLYHRQQGLTYLPDIDERLTKALAIAQKFKLVHDGRDFTLYQAQAGATGNPPALVDLQWQHLLEYMQQGLGDKLFVFPLQVRQFTGGEVVTDSAERSFYTLYSAVMPAQTFRPSTKLLPFTSSQVASSNFTNNALSLSTLQAADSQYNHLREVVPSLVGLRTPQFIGLARGAGELDVPFTVPGDGTYRIAVHGGARAGEIMAHLGGQKVSLKKIVQDQAASGDYIDFTYFYADIPLLAGEHVLKIQPQNDRAILVESATLLPQKDVPQDFTRIDSPHIRMQPSVNPLIFNATVQEAQP